MGEPPEPTSKGRDVTGTLTLAVYDWDDAYGKPAPYIVSSTPNAPAPVLWDGLRWIELSHEVMTAVVAPPENVEGLRGSR